MKSDVFLSSEEFAKRECLIKRKQEHLIQVREQSKKMAATVLERLKRETERQYQDTENRVLSELREHYSKELAVVRQYYNKCVSEINQQHYVKQVGIGQKNNGTVKFAKTSILKKSSDMRQGNETQSQKEVVTTVKPSNSKEKKCLSTLPVKNGKFKERTVPKPVEILPENIVVDSDENSHHNDYVEQKNECFSDYSSKKMSINTKEPAKFHNKENCYSKNGRNRMTNGRQKKDCCKHVQKIAHSNLDERETRNNIFDPDLEFQDVIEQRNMNEMYNRVVHDRIRILEQKEKILRKRISPLPLPISNTDPSNKLNRFSEYFLRVRDKNISLNSVQKNILPESNKINTGVVNEGLMDGIENDLTRVHLKKQLLVLELSNAETQTDKKNTLVDDRDRSTEMPVITERPVLDKNEPEKHVPLYSPTKINEKPVASRTWCPSPIPKENESSEDKPANVIESPIHKTAKLKKNRLCKRKKLHNNKNIVITVLNNKAKVSNSTDTSSSLVTQDFAVTQSSVESDLSAETCNSHKTVKVIVNVLSNPECKRNKCPPSYKFKNEAYFVEDKQFKKLQNWRKVFENEEKLTESSYFSPPEAVIKKDHVDPNRMKKLNKSMEESEKQKVLLPHDMGYYVRKLLLMSADSVENLNVSSCSTAIINESDENIPVSKIRKEKLPLHLPLYQNSFDDTLDAVFQSKFIFSENNSVRIENETTSAPDESGDLSSSIYLRKYVSSLSNSSALESESPPINNEIHYQQAKSIETDPEKIPAMTDHREQNFSSSFALKVEERKNIAENFEDEQIKLPSIEELLRRGFISEPLISRKSDDYDTLEEDEFIKEMLKVNIQPIKVSDEKEEKGKCSASPLQELSNNFQHSKIDETQPETDSSNSKYVNISTEANKEPVNTELPTYKEKSRLLGWMGATVQRTLEASAINSTSSGDSSDPVRKLPKTLVEIVENQSECTMKTDSVSSDRFSFSPIKIPDIHLCIPPIFKNP